MMFFVTILIVPLILACVAFLLSKTICVKELFLIVGVQLCIAIISSLIVYNIAIGDVEIWNGYVIDKQVVSVPCSHSYKCMCHNSCVGEGKNRTCTEICSTCYDHNNDFNWLVYTSNDETIKISRVDRQGKNKPQRWDETIIGETTAIEHSFENYVKAAPDSLFVRVGSIEKYKKLIPDYPRTYDYYRLKRVLLVNDASIEQAFEWEKTLDDLSSKYGKQSQLNILLVVVNKLDRDYFYALEQSWLGAKKNDVVVVVGISDDVVNWAEVMTWDLSADFETRIKNSLEGKRLSWRDFTDEFNDDVKFRHRKPMKDFEYLRSNITPTTGEWIVSLVIGLLISGMMSVFFHKNETFKEYKGKKW